MDETTIETPEPAKPAKPAAAASRAGAKALKRDAKKAKKKTPQAEQEAPRHGAAVSGHTGGGAAVNGEYAALLSLGGVTEAMIRSVVRCNAALRRQLRDAVRELPGVVEADHSPALTMAAELARGEHGKPSAEGLWAGLCEAARARVVKGADLPPSIKTWAQLSRRASEYKSELLISTLVHAEHNAEAAAQQPEQLAQTERRFARLSDAGRLRVTSRATTFGPAVVGWPELLRYAQSRSEVAELTALIDVQLGKEREAADKRQAAAALKANAPAAPAPASLPPGTLSPTDAHARRKTTHRSRRSVAGKA